MRRSRVSPALGALAVAWGCGSSSSSPGGANTSAPAKACADFYEASAGQCNGAPAALLTQGVQRFVQACLNQLAAPGEPTTPAMLEACVQVLDASCDFNDKACQFPNSGNLPGGSPCEVNLDVQCQSGSCVAAASTVVDGGARSTPACGMCAPVISVGQPCDPGNAGVCATGSQCDQTMTPPTCVTRGASGDPCRNGTCAVELTCDGSMHCAPLGMEGAACSTLVDCVSSLVCAGGTCESPGSAGAACTTIDFCKPGLLCDTTMHCSTPVYVQPGGACGTGALLCITGSCSQTTKTCPAIVPDGQPCPAPTDDTRTCDGLASCINGVCALPGATACP